MQIGKTKLKSDIIVAPLAGISNDAFRQLCFEFGAGLVYSEMISDKAIYYSNQRTMDMLKISKEVHPVSLQLFGNDIKTMVYAARIMDKQTDCDFIDINMGCPVNKVVKTGSGSAMMKNEDETVVIVKQIIENVSKPVTVKMRLGYDNVHLNYLSLSKKLEEVGVSAIALHARSRTQMYEGHADWNHIRILKENLKIPVIGNGDVKNVDDYVNIKKQTNCDGVMIGRALIGNPFLIKEIENYNSGKTQYVVSRKEKFENCLLHTRKLIDLLNEKAAISQMRGIAPHYLTGMYNSTSYKEKLNHISSYKELEDILKEYNDYLEKHES